MGTFGPMHWIILAVLALVLFGGRGKLSRLMGDAAKGIKALKEGLKDDSADAKKEPEATAQPLPRTDKEQDPIVR